MRVEIRKGEQIRGWVWLGRDKQLKCKAVTKQKQPEFEHFVMQLFKLYHLHPRRDLTPREFLELLPQRLTGINYANPVVPRKRQQSTLFPVALQA